MDDDIQLPPLPPFVIAPIADEQTVLDYARAAILADRERQAEKAKPAKPKVHSRTLRLTNDGTIYREHENVTAVAVVTIRWTDDGRVWIDSERNRELAKELRRLHELGLSIHCLSAADALDGGVR